MTDDEIETMLVQFRRIADIAIETVELPDPEEEAA